MSWFVPHGIRNISNNEAKLIKQALSAGAYMERERIIALLEADMDNLGDDGKCVMTNHYPESCHCEIIAIIKGEQK